MNINAGDLPVIPPVIPLDGRRAVSPPTAAPRGGGALRRARARSGLGRAGFAALLAGGPRPQLADAMEPVVRAHRSHHPGADIALLGRAYEVAEASHRGQTRKSGEPYITHPLAVTMILAQLGAETTALVASLLHDTVEDTAVTLDQVRAGFGDEVAYLVDGVTKLEKVDFGAAAEAETFRKMLLATGEDVRVMVIKLADRLHNMRTIRHMKPASQVRIAKVTRDVLIPLAERLGIQVVKTELEDIVFATLHPEEYARTQELLAAHERAEADPLGEFAGLLRRQLREARIQAEVTVRPRHCVSVHRALLHRTELTPCDFGRLLVVVEENADCYAVLGELHTCWTPLPGEFKDFIAGPKFNLYQSLHTAVTTGPGQVVEVLVRTEHMHRVAEFGVVALDTPGGGTAEEQPAEGGDGAGPGSTPERDELDRTDPARPGWLARLLDWQRETPDADTFWSALTADLSGDGELTVVTEGGGTLQLPSGSSCVDVAYALGEDVGHRCIGARVNGRLTALSTLLRDGDAVDVLTESGEPGEPGGEPGGPDPEWLAHARTPSARIAIERWLAEHPAAPQPPADQEHPPSGPPAAAPRTAAPRASAPRAAASAAEAPRQSQSAAVVAAGLPDAPVRLARCCTPVPPDALVGFAIRGGAVAVHRRDCRTGIGMAVGGRTPVQVAWARDAAPSGYRVTVQADALGRPRLLADLTAAMSATGVDIVSASVEPPQELRVRHTYTVELPDAGALPELMRAMLRVAGVYDVYRAGPQGSDGPENGDDPAGAGMRPSSAGTTGMSGEPAAFSPASPHPSGSPTLRTQ
ncbi:bifunctional (p)ppGpp synthetase/guanosine-3',5'-bis(diphosphate) 3'-pyrophosphohydrolase [Streptacidiphilus sp. PB12-B1b]|uniref:RelA/SpoT family protein n=1 Tax=Streptacidiphilus sp. PB12-B1b TaxID=2705012 RepID=UPI0015FA915B|nr:HD domain-containing protein [Streptacidiphilus sp. PB12-B1b]QMU78743.1 bifunctional (p)ppGpp synthetase/guanosine-3',5'-bis(diphosphate) 3'-pyrophosphohydrolase [Streptacidiphilus sp. PB12-B1b]